MTREIALHCMKSYSELHSDLCELCPIYGETGSDHCFEDALQYVIGMLERDLSSELDKNSKKLEKDFDELDCISRADVLKLMQDNWHTHNGDWAMQESMDDIRALPAVTPIRPKGHWIPMYQGDEIIDYRCSECEFGNTFGKGTFGMNFCPRCGSDNREVEP